MKSTLRFILESLDLGGNVSYEDFLSAMYQYAEIEDKELANGLDSEFETDSIRTWEVIAATMSSMLTLDYEKSTDIFSNAIKQVKNLNWDKVYKEKDLFEIKKSIKFLELALEVTQKFMDLHGGSCSSSNFNFTNTSFATQKAKTEKIEFVYIAKQTNEKGYYKIGRTNDISNRLNTFKTGNCFVEMIMSKQTEKASTLEAFLHKYFKDKNIKNEWFLLNEEDLNILVDMFDFNVHITENEN